jgi:hypothetical protein
MGLDTKTYWLTDRQSQYDFRFDIQCSQRFFREIRQTDVIKKEFNVWALIIGSNCNLSANKSNNHIQNPLLLVTLTRNTTQIHTKCFKTICTAG